MYKKVKYLALKWLLEERGGVTLCYFILQLFDDFETVLLDYFSPN